jgi:hypothetical protein
LSSSQECNGRQSPPIVTNKRPTPQGSAMRHSHCETALALTTLLLLLSACRQEQLSLPVTHAADSETQSVSGVSSEATFLRTARTTEEKYEPAPGASCYTFFLLRPRNQRATAVQARLKQADKMAAALDSRTVTVDLLGDHANILSLKAPAQWPAPPVYADRLSAIIEDYFRSPDIEDYMCNSGFAEVRLSVLGLNDRRIHPLWTARVTSEGLLKIGADGEQLTAEDPLSLP